MGSKGSSRPPPASSILLQRGDRRHDPRLPHPAARRATAREEVQIAQQVLQSLGLRSFTPQVSACPGCGRTTSTFFQEMARDINDYLRAQMPVWRERIPASRR